MKWEYFTEFYLIDLYNLWSNWIPYKDRNEKRGMEEKFHAIDRYREYDEDEYEDNLVTLVDEGDRVTSFRDFVYCAYENTMP